VFGALECCRNLTKPKKLGGNEPSDLQGSGESTIIFGAKEY